MRFRLDRVLIVALLSAGCNSATDSTTAPTDNAAPAEDDVASASTPANESNSGDAAAEVDVEVASWEQIQQAIAAQQGRVVVVDLWSTTCLPCRREFPGLVKLHEEHVEDVACISVSLDYYGDPAEPPEAYRPAVVEFLTDKGATFQNFLCSDPSDEVLAQVDAGAMPVVLVYNRQGELTKKFEDDGSYGDEGFSYENHVTPFVEELLAGSP